MDANLYAGTYANGVNSFVVTSDGNDIQWNGSSNVLLTNYANNIGTTGNSSSPLLKRVFTFNDVGAVAVKSWVISYNDNTLTSMGFTSTDNNGWAGTWTSARNGSFTIQQPSPGTYTLTRNGQTFSCLFIDATNLTNVMLSHFYDNSAQRPVVVAKVAANGIYVFTNAASGAWVSEAFDKI